jgi:trehalose 6-phosphate synthase
LARLVLVSNRTALPKGEATQRAGGLEVVLAPILKTIPSVWFGWSGKVVRTDKVATETIEGDNASYVVTDLAKEDYEEYYNGFANRVLWPVLHYHIDLTEFTRRDLTGYFRVNRHFADELEKILRPDDVVWVHDYHLIPIAAELRQRGHANALGFFLHVPFPAPEVVTVLPNHGRLLPQLLQYDLVGFQTETDVGNFVRYLVAEHRGADRGTIEATNGQFVFTARGRKTRIGNFPVGIDVAQFERLARRAVRSSFVREVVESLSGRALLIGVDRLDYSKGLVQRMEAIERFFDIYPAWRGKVTYLQIAPKTRSEIPTYAELEQAVGGAVGRINGKCGEIAWTPIRYLTRAFSRSTLAGLFRSARVGVVTPLRDGMNLVAKEYVAAQDAADPGVLILSRFTGAAAECEGALLVNPYDTESVARAMADALDMTLAERRKRHETNLEALERNGGNAWSTRFLQSLQAGREPMDRPSISGLDALLPYPSFAAKDNRQGGSTA